MDDPLECLIFRAGGLVSFSYNVVLFFFNFLITKIRLIRKTESLMSYESIFSVALRSCLLSFSAHRQHQISFRNGRITTLVKDYSKYGPNTQFSIAKDYSIHGQNTQFSICEDYSIYGRNTQFNFANVHLVKETRLDNFQLDNTLLRLRRSSQFFVHNLRGPCTM
jgi:hypothetical protein